MEDTKIPELTDDSDEGFVDRSLRLDEMVRERDGRHRFKARASHKGMLVSFAVSLGPTWREQELEGTTEFLYWGEARLISLGAESDAFLQALDQLYENQSRRLSHVCGCGVHGRQP